MIPRELVPVDGGRYALDSTVIKRCTGGAHIVLFRRADGSLSTEDVAAVMDTMERPSLLALQPRDCSFGRAMRLIRPALVLLEGADEAGSSLTTIRQACPSGERARQQEGPNGATEQKSSELEI